MAIDDEELASIKSRLELEVQRQPIFDAYPPIEDLHDALIIALEVVEEWDYESDKHGWCHRRPILMTLIKAAVDGLGREGS